MNAHRIQWRLLALLLLHAFDMVWSLSIKASSIASAASKVDKTSRDDIDALHWTKIHGMILKGERRAEDRDKGLREVCGGCGRPQNLCLCLHLPPTRLPTATDILILQHPNERRKRNMSTTPLVQLALENCVVKVGYDFDESILEHYPEHTPLLLYLSPDAIVLDGGDGDESDSTSNFLSRNDDNPPLLLLILIDGTWGEAKRMVRESPRLVERCQKVAFQSIDETSIYDVLRKEPQAHCLSTLEACGKALACLETENGDIIQQTLQSLLQAHVNAHLANRDRHQQLGPRYVNRKAPVSRQELIEERVSGMEQARK